MAECVGERLPMGGSVGRRLTAMGLLVLTLSFGGCTVLNPPPTQQCTLFGCKQTGNIIKELGGMIVVMGVIAIAITGVVRRMTK